MYSKNINVDTYDNNTLGKSNCTFVQVGFLTIYYSYQTPIAFSIFDEESPSVVAIRKNPASNTTGKHISTIRKRYAYCQQFDNIPGEQFLSLLAVATKALLNPLTSELKDELLALMGDKEAQVRM